MGARHACFFCRDRVTEGGRCARCARPRLELAGHQANGKLALLARRVHEATARDRSSGGARWTLVSNVTHAIAFAGALLFIGFAVQIQGVTGAARVLLVLVGGALGYLVGYLSVGLALVGFMLATALCSLSLTSLLLMGAGGVALLTLLVPGARGARARAAIAEWTEATVGRLFAPVFRLRGARLSPLAAPAQEPAELHRPRRHEGLRPTPPALALPERTICESEVLEGTLVTGEEVSIGSLRATIVGVAGYTVGSRVEDAAVAPFVLETAERRVHVEVEVGAVIVARALGEARRVEDLPLAWGVARSRRNPDKLPPVEPTALFVVRPGARLRVEGGERSVRSAAGDTPGDTPGGMLGYRGARFELTVRGTRAYPVRITVL